jgi:hypothetical protein
MCVGWAACQGCIEMMGVKSLPFFIGLASPWAAVAVLVLTFMFGYFINYVFPREDAEKLILRWKLGNLFKRKVGVSEAEEPIYENYTIIERGVFKIFAVLSLCTALNIFGLGVASILEWTFVPLVVAHIIPLVLIVPACLLFTNTVHNYIDEKGIDKLKNYYHLHIKPNSFKDYVKLPFELIKVIGTIAISVIVFFATFLILQSKALMLFSSVFSINTANTLANMTTGITASVKAIFSLSKISHLFGSAISCIFYRKKSERSVPDMEEDKKTERETKIDKETASTIEIFKTIQRKETGVRIAITVVEAVAVGCHGFAEKGLAVQSLNHESLVRTLNHQQLRSPLEQVVIEDGKAWYAWLTTFKSAVLGNKSQNEYEMKPSSRLVR